MLDLLPTHPGETRPESSDISIFPALKRLSELRAAVKQKEAEEKARLKGMF